MADGDDVRLRVAAFVCIGLVGCENGAVQVLLATSEQGENVTDPSPRARAVLDDAFGWWGVRYSLENTVSDHGKLVVRLFDLSADAAFLGGATQPAACRRTVWSTFDPIVLRHELGHAWMLDHAEPEENLMHIARGDGETVTQEQLDAAQDSIDLFLACR
jgi:hypothetical protein